MDPKTHYTPTENGYAISGSCELFNRTLYGSHKNDEQTARFFTFAGDAPQFMGTVTDWAKDPVTYQEKCGVLVSGLALTPQMYMQAVERATAEDVAAAAKTLQEHTVYFLRGAV